VLEKKSKKCTVQKVVILVVYYDYDYCFYYYYTVTQKKNSQTCFCHNFVNFSIHLIIFGTKMAKTTELCKVHSFSAALHLCQRT